MTKQKLSWDIIKFFLEKELKSTNHILTFGTIGSCNIEHDVDLIVTKKSQSKTSDFYKEFNQLIESLDNYLKNYNSKAIIFYTMMEEEFLRYLDVYKKQDVGLHLMVYFSFPQIKIDWAGAQDIDLGKLFKEDYNCLWGGVNDLFNSKFQDSNPLDATYNFLFQINKSKYYPKEFRFNYMKKILDYLSRKRLKIKPVVVGNEDEIDKKFYLFCDELDKINNEIKRSAHTN